MDDNGMIYVPNTCKDKQCRLHVSLHGCQQGMNFNHGYWLALLGSKYGDQYIKNTGYLQWAADNEIIVLMPQVVNTSGTEYNPLGCWEFFAFSPDSKWDTNEGSQTAAIKRMVDRLMAGDSEDSADKDAVNDFK